MTLIQRQSIRGRAPSLPTVLSVRELEPQELADRLARENGSKGQALQRLSSRHRELAKYLASGASVTAAAARFGLTVSRVSILKQNTAFMELIRFYEDSNDFKHFGVEQLLEGVAETSLATLQDRLEEDDSQFTNSELMAMAKLGADRTGHAPAKKIEGNFTVNIGTRLAAARQRVTAQVIEGDTAKDITNV